MPARNALDQLMFPSVGASEASEGWVDRLKQGVLANAARSALESLMLPGDVLSGRFNTKPSQPGMWSDEDEARAQLNDREAMNRAVDLAGTVMGGAYPAAQPGAVGIFGGRLAKTADLAALAKAEDMAAKGASREQIWNDTGWFQGADGKWRFEIDDSPSRVSERVAKPMAAANIDAPVGIEYAERFLEHPALHAAYPNLPNVQVTKGGGYPFEPTGFYQERASGLKQIGLHAETPAQARDVGLHEFQHAIQGNEGFARGAQNFAAKDDGYALSLAQDVNKRYRPLLDELSNSGRWDEFEKLEAARLAEVNAIFDADRAAPGGLGYHRAAGEVEARNVQTRRDMNAEQRKRLPPWKTQDVPDELQIIKF